MSELLAIAERALAHAASGEQMEVYVARSTEHEVSAYDGAIEDLTVATSAGVGIRILIDGPGGARVGSAWAGSLDDDTVVAAIADARDNVTFSSEDEFLSFARPDGVPAVPLQLVGEDVATTTMDERVAWAIELERRVRGGDHRIRQVRAAGYGDWQSASALVSTAGIVAETQTTGASLSALAIAGDDQESQTGSGYSVARRVADLDHDKVVREAIEHSTRMLGATKPKSFRGAAVFDARTGATLLSIIGSALSGDAVVRGRSFFAGRLGEMVASPLVTLHDDPTDPRHFGSAPFDGEGIASRRNSLIEGGQLAGFVYDTVSARRAGTASTGSAVRGGMGATPSAGCRALLLQTGERSLEELFQFVGDGVYVTELQGVHSGVNPVSGDFSVGVTGFVIRNGVLAEPIREATVASTLQRMLLDVIAVGRDVEWLPGAAAGVPVAIAGISVSGA